jgi:hypothetical protein
MTILTESIQALMAVKRAYSELGDAAAALAAAMAQRDEALGGDTIEPPNQERDPNATTH